MEVILNEWLEWLSVAIAGNIWLAPALALAAGVLTSFTPCSLSTIPLVFAYVGGTSDWDSKRSFLLSAVFAGGSAVALTVLGTAASLLGRLMRGAGSWWYIALGVLMILMALQTWEVFSFIPSTYAVSKNSRRGYTGAFLAGILGGLFSSPCSTPVLVALLAIVAQRGSLLWGMVLLLLYSAGYSALILIAGTSVGFVKKLSVSGKYGALSAALRAVMGAAMLLLAFYLFYLGF
jgi:cytochrome c biogenesis protein CcdA